MLAGQALRPDLGPLGGAQLLVAGAAFRALPPDLVAAKAPYLLVSAWGHG